MKMNLDDVRFAVDAVQLLDSVTSSVNGLYPIEGVEWLITAEINFSSATVLRIADFEGLPSKNSMGSVNARTLQDVRRVNNEKQRRDERPERFLEKPVPNGQHVEMLRQVRAPPAHVEE